MTKAKEVEEFNKQFPIGTPVEFWTGLRVGEGRQSVTRSEAWVMPSGSAVVQIKGVAGCVALSHVKRL